MRRKNKSATAFQDLLLNVILGLFVLLMLSIVSVNPVSKNGDIDLNAEYLITVEWPQKSTDDVDIFVKIPGVKNVCFYGNKDAPFTSLDRDDQGQRMDLIVLPSGETVEVLDNWEHMTFRKLLDGQYIANIYLFSQNQNKTPVEVTVKLEKLNPYRVLYTTKIMLTTNRQEETALRFEAKNGKIINIDSFFQSIVGTNR